MSRKVTLVATMAVSFLLLITLSASAANPPFTAKVIDNNYFNCTTVSAADVNRDGKMDIISANWEGTGLIVWWQNLGDGLFSSAVKDVVSASFPGATSLYADDLDHDGDVDIAAISTINNKFAWFENHGPGAWQKWDLSSSFSPIAALSPVGVERHGKHAMVAGRTSLLNNIIYAFTFPSSPGPVWGNYSVVDFPDRFQYVSALYPDDVDLDGDVDIVAASRFNHTIAWYEYDAGSLKHQRHLVGDRFRAIWVQTGDIDQDGDADIFAASDTLGLWWWENIGGTGTSWAQHPITQQEVYVASSLHAADLDNDGDLDLTAATKNQMIWWENLGSPRQTANWIRHVMDTNNSVGAQGYALFPADINGDGQVDIVSCDRRAGTGQSMRLGWWENEHEMPTASDIGFWSMAINTTLTGAWGVDVADFNSDGRLDVAAAGYGAGATKGETRWWRNNTAQTWANWPLVYSASFDKGRGVTAFSIGRGWPRYQVSGNYGTGQVEEFYSNNWDWTGASHWTRLSGLTDTYMSTVADLNNDGILDVIGTSAQNGDIVWARSNLTDITWQQLKIGENCDGARGVAAADIDGDGDVDVAGACSNESRIHWWENGNDGASWTQKTIPVNFAGATDVKCADMDGDGAIEMVAASPGLWSIAWFKPNATIGDGTTMGWVTDSFTGTEYIHLADLDRDGDLDVVATSNQRDELAWFENKITTPAACYSGCFTPHVFGHAGGFREVVVGDIQGDGAPDVVAAAQDDNSVYWYPQAVGAELYLEKWLDTAESTDVISTGQSIPYIIEITNMGPPAADVLVVDTWEPSDAVVDASGESCVADTSRGVMTCTRPMHPAGIIKQLKVAITPSLLYDGYITNTARLVPVGPFYNTDVYYTPDQAAPVEVQRDPSICDMIVRPGYYPTEGIFPGGYFMYSMMVMNMGPKSLTAGTLTNRWSPAVAIADLNVIGVGSGSSVSAMSNSCTTNADTGEVSCNFNLTKDVPITVTVGVTTSMHFTDVLETAVTLTGADEGNPANNQTWPIRVGSRPFEKIYLPIIMKNH